MVNQEIDIAVADGVFPPIFLRDALDFRCAEDREVLRGVFCIRCRW